MKFDIYHTQNNVDVLGPGCRYGIWVQGCTLGCPGCLVPDSHNREENMVDIESIINDIAATDTIEGITISGGEPFQQPEPLLAFLEHLGDVAPHLSVMIFSGYNIDFLIDRYPKILSKIDILVDGLFKRELRINDPWRGSSNQIIHYLSERYSQRDHRDAKSGPSFEVFVRENGVFIAGVPSESSAQVINQLERR